MLSGVGHHSPLFCFLSFPFSQHSHFSLSPRHPLSPSPSQSLPRYHAANSSFPAFDAVLGQFGAGFGAILRVFWGSTGQYWERIWGRFWCRCWGQFSCRFGGKKEECIGFFPMHGNVKKCAVGKYPKSEKLGSAGQAACCACAHSRYLTGGSPSGLRV